MTRSERILKDFDEGYPKFKWFIEKHFTSEVIAWVEKYREAQDTVSLLKILNRVWYALPDDEFNIVNNPKGWAEFLKVIEE